MMVLLRHLGTKKGTINKEKQNDKRVYAVLLRHLRTNVELILTLRAPLPSSVSLNSYYFTDATHFYFSFLKTVIFKHFFFLLTLMYHN